MVDKRRICLGQRLLRRRLATKARQLTLEPPKLAFKGEHARVENKTPHKELRTRSEIIRNTIGRQDEPNRKKLPGVNIIKWKYGDIIKVGSINVRGMVDPVKRE